ncbi:MAG: YraN family protein [Patescibacteria group bacterium]
MPKVFTSEKQKIGELGENMAVKFLVKQGFKVLDRNYTKKWGEIDIIAKKDSKLYFIEVKSVSSIVNPNSSSDYRAEDNMHPWKMQRLSRTIQTYLLEKDVDEDIEWQVDLLVVYLDLKTNKAKVKVVNDIIL